MGDPTFQIFWTSWPKKVNKRHQTLSQSLRRGRGLGMRLGRTAECTSTVVQVTAFHFIDFAVARQLALNLLLLYNVAILWSVYHCVAFLVCVLCQSVYYLK